MTTYVPAPRAKLGAPLTQYQFNVAWLYSTGLDRKEVARRLGRSHHSVESALKMAKLKLGLSTKIQLAEHFEREGV